MTTSPEPRIFTLASRASKLAQVQTNAVCSALQALPPSDTTGFSFKAEFLTNALGDRDKETALYILGGKATWTKELEVALLQKDVDILVHCAKDVPTTLPEGCVIAGTPEREDPVDALVIKKEKEGIWKTLEDLPDGSVVGTSSIRRVAQLKRKFPKLAFQDLRGNIDTRLSRLDDPNSPFSAVVLAKAGLVRINLGHRISSDLGPPTLMYAVSQAALALEVRSDDTAAIELCRKITHEDTWLRCAAERGMLRVLEGGCSVPVGVSSSIERCEDGKKMVLKLSGCVTALDGTEHIEDKLEREISSAEDAERVGQDLAKILSDNGAKNILDFVTKHREQQTKEAEEKQ